MADNDIFSAITTAAANNGVDPNWALAVAERESNFDADAKASKTIHGMFQMTKGLRDAYGVGDSKDPAVQSEGFMKYVNGEIKPQMKSVLGRDPTPQEMYLGHHFGPVRAAKMIASGHPDTPVSDVFTRYERSINPHFDKAGTTGNLMSSITSDMDKRMARYGGGDLPKVAGTAPANKATTPFDYSAFGSPVSTDDLQMADNPAASEHPAATASAEQQETDTGATPQLKPPTLSQPSPLSVPPPPKVQVAQGGVPMPKLPGLGKASFGLDPRKVLAAKPGELANALGPLMGQA